MVFEYTLTRSNITRKPIKQVSKERSDLLGGCKLEPESQLLYLNQLDKTLTALNKYEETQ